jgi:hypothetical protein
MDREMIVYAAFLLAVVVVCSYLSVKAWIDARRMEREAFYRTEALKKFIELQGNVPDPVLDTLRHAIEPKSQPPKWFWYDYTSEREAYYRCETLKRLAVMPEGAAAVLEYLRHDDNRTARRRREASKLRGMVVAATGAGLMLFGLASQEHGLFLVGFIPFLVGTVMLVHAFVIGSGTGNQRKTDSGLNNE